MVTAPTPRIANDLASLVEAQRQTAKVIDGVSDAIQAATSGSGNPLDAAMQRLHETVKDARDTIADAMLEVSALVGDLVRTLAVCSHALGEAFAPAPAPECRSLAEPEEVTTPATAPEPTILPLPTPDEPPTHEDEAAASEEEFEAEEPTPTVAVAANAPVAAERDTRQSDQKKPVKKPSTRKPSPRK